VSDDELRARERLWRSNKNDVGQADAYLEALLRSNPTIGVRRLLEEVVRWRRVGNSMVCSVTGDAIMVGSYARYTDMVTPTEVLEFMLGEDSGGPRKKTQGAPPNDTENELTDLCSELVALIGTHGVDSDEVNNFVTINRHIDGFVDLAKSIKTLSGAA
jgi:hypothetical protein